MRRIAAILTAALLLLLGTTTPATAAPAPLGGGSILYNGFYRCTVAFAARQATTGRLLAGPGCAAPVGTQLYSGNNVLVGQVYATYASGGVALVTVTNTTAWQLVPWIPFGGGQYTVRGSAETPVGGSVCLVDQALGHRCGLVTAKNQTVHFSGGTITGLTRTNLCMSARSAVAFVSGDQAQGIPLGATGSCTSGGVSYFQPVNPLLSAYGLALVTG
jgi:streptogrisin C